MEKLKKLVKDELTKIEETGINDSNIEKLDILVDVYKELNKDMEDNKNMRYNGYNDNYMTRNMNMDMPGSYQRGRSRDSMGRFTRGRYNGPNPEMFDRMRDGYEGYMEGMSEYSESGNYGAKDKGLEALEYMLDGFVGFFENLQDTMQSPEEVEMIKKYARKIKEM